MTRRTITITAAAIIAATAVGYLLTLRPGHDWGGDFSLYIHHAENIAHGKPYADTGFVFNPYYPYLSPDSYPPVFPLMLAPIVKARGIDLLAMKVVVAGCFVLALVPIWLLFRDELPAPHALMLLAAIALNPWFWDYKDQVLSDLPFLLFMYAALLFLRRAYARRDASQTPWRNAVLAAVFVCLACGTRSLGITLVAAIIGHDLIRYRRPTRILAVIVGAFAVFAMLQTVLLRSESSYLSLLKWNPQAMLAKLVFLPLPELWANGYEGVSEPVRTLTFTVTCVITLLAIAGYVIRLRRRITVLELFGPLYVLPLFLIPEIQGMRYLVPLVPLYIFYCLVALSEWTFLQRPDVKKALFAGLCVAIFGSYVARYTTARLGRIDVGPEKAESLELFEFVRNNTEPNDTIIFRKPRVLSLYTDRPASIYPLVVPEDPGDLWDHVRNINARYIIAGPFFEDKNLLNLTLRESGGRLEQVFTNPDFVVYRVKD